MFVFIYKRKKMRKGRRKKNIAYKANKKFLKFQFKGVVGSIKRIAGELEFL